MRIAIAVAAVAAIVTLRTLGALELPATEAAPADAVVADADASAEVACRCPPRDDLAPAMND